MPASSGVARAVVEDAGSHAQSRGVRVELLVGDAAMVRGDGFLLRQLLANLVDNAIDFSPAGGVVDVRIAADADVVRIELADRGPGVPGYALERVFERFYSLPRPDGGARSSGLGLNFVAEIAQLHGGSASLQNREGGGAIATVVLPLA